MNEQNGKTEYQEWLDSLKVGDPVLVVSVSTLPERVRNMEVGTIEEITEVGRTIVVNGKGFKNGYYAFRPWTREYTNLRKFNQTEYDEYLESRRRERFAMAVEERVACGITYEQAVEIAKILGIEEEI